MKSPSKERNKFLLNLAIILFGITHLGIYLLFTPLYSDLQLYFSFVVQAFDLHRSAYTDLRIGYPPVAWWVMAFPFFFSKAGLNINDPAYVEQARQAYDAIFRGFMFACDIGAFALMISLIRRRRPGREGIGALFYVGVTVLLAHVLYDRFDACLLFLLILPAYFWTLAHENSDPRRRTRLHFLSYLIVGLGISFKVIPVILVPFLMISQLSRREGARAILGGMGALAVGGGLPFLVQFWVSGPDVFDLFRHHAERGIQLESIYATVMAALSPFGFPIGVRQAAGAFDLTSPLTPLMQVVSKIVLLSWLLFWGGQSLLPRCRLKAPHAFTAGFLAIGGAVIFSHVLSPQYFVWALPLMLIVGIEIFDNDSGVVGLGLLLIVIAATTLWIFPYHYFYGADGYGLIVREPRLELPPDMFAYYVLAFRNVLYLGVTGWLAVSYFRKSWATAGNFDGYS